jgi:hypothetical protein
MAQLTFTIKGQTVSIFSFAGQMVFAKTTQHLCQIGWKYSQAVGKRMGGCVPIKLYLEKQVVI